MHFKQSLYYNYKCCLFSDGASSSSKSSHDKLEPEVYKTRKDENFTEYFKIHKNQVGIPLMDLSIVRIKIL